MKRALIGGFLTVAGTIWCLAGLLASAFQVQYVSEWFTPPGRFVTAMMQCGMSWAVALGGLLLALGLIILGVEYFRKED